MALSLLLIAFVALAISYSLIIPLFEGPDEDEHFRYAKYVADHHALPVQEFIEGGGAAGHQGWQPPLYYSLAALLISPIDTTDYAQHLWRNEGWAAIGDPACCGHNIYYHTDNEAFPFTRTTLAVHLARLLAVCFGAVTVWATYALVREYAAVPIILGQSSVDSSRLLPLAAASVVAFNPSFLFASALVSNDTLLAALSALVLLLWVRLLVGRVTPDLTSAMVLGMLIGLALLTKTTALALVPFSLAVFGLVSWRRRDYRTLVLGSAVMLGVVALVAGWWLVRNTVLYGDPLAYRLMTFSALFERSGPLTLAELFQISLPWLWQTFWGGPTPGDFSPVLLAALFLLTVLASFGMIVFAIRNTRFEARLTIAFLVAWLGTILVAQVQFIRMTVGADQGRYLFPAISVLALALALGLTALAGRRLAVRLVLTSIMLAMFLLALFVPFAYTLPAYARPALLSEAQVARIQHPMDVGFADQIHLLGYDLQARSVKPRETLSIALYWRARAPMSDSYRVFVHLIGTDDASAGGADVIPARGAFPTVYWKPGDTFRDVVQIPIAPDVTPGKYEVEIGLYPVGKPWERLIASDSGDDRVIADAIKVAPPQPVAYTPQTRTDAIFGEKARLNGYDTHVEADSLTLVLYWQDIARFERDYTVFVHVVDSNGNILAQADHEPQAGNYPTSFWDPGEQVRDEYVLPLKASPSYRIQLGMYRGDTKERLGVRIAGNESDYVEFSVPGTAP